jgi:hypothetical protein
MAMPGLLEWLGGAPRRETAALPVAADPAPPVARGSSSGLAPFRVDLPDGWDTWPLGRDQVWLIPAAAQGIQVIAGTIGTLPLARRRGRDVIDLGTLLTQPDPEEPRVSTLTRLVEDLVLFPTAYLIVLERDSEDFPRHVRYVPNELVEPADPPQDAMQPPTPPTRYRIGVGPGIELPARDVLRFPSHWPGLLVVGARALRTAMLLESAAQRFANMDVPAGTLKNRGADLPPAGVDELLARWEAARRSHGVGYTNAMIDFQVTQFDAAQMQLVDARRWSTAEIARLLNLPSRYLNAETESSMTYSNVESARRDLVDLSLRPYLSGTEGRLSLPDVTPRGQRVTWELDAFYRGDLQARAAYYTAALNPAAPWLVVDEVRTFEGLPPMGGGPSEPIPHA